MNFFFNYSEAGALSDGPFRAVCSRSFCHRSGNVVGNCRWYVYHSATVFENAPASDAIFVGRWVSLLYWRRHLFRVRLHRITPASVAERRFSGGWRHLLFSFTTSLAVGAAAASGLFFRLFELGFDSGSFSGIRTAGSVVLSAASAQETPQLRVCSQVSGGSAA